MRLSSFAASSDFILLALDFELNAALRGLSHWMVGNAVGARVVCFDGLVVGHSVGSAVFISVVGCLDGAFVGIDVAFAEGARVDLCL